MAFSAPLVVAQLQTLPKPAPFSGTLFRSVNYLYVRGSGANVLTGAYAGQVGGRYNPPGSDGVCYLSGTQTNAAFEVEQVQLLMGLGSTPNPPPRITFGVRLVGAVLLDLCNGMIRHHLGIVGDASDLFMPTVNWQQLNRHGIRAPTQELGAAARAAGYDGVRYPAILQQYIGGVLPGLENVALFMSPAAPATPINPHVVLDLHDHGLLHP